MSLFIHSRFLCILALIFVLCTTTSCDVETSDDPYDLYTINTPTEKKFNEKPVMLEIGDTVIGTSRSGVYYIDKFKCYGYISDTIITQATTGKTRLQIKKDLEKYDPILMLTLNDVPKENSVLALLACGVICVIMIPIGIFAFFKIQKNPSEKFMMYMSIILSVVLWTANLSFLYYDFSWEGHTYFFVFNQPHFMSKILWYAVFLVLAMANLLCFFNAFVYSSVRYDRYFYFQPVAIALIVLFCATLLVHEKYVEWLYICLWAIPVIHLCVLLIQNQVRTLASWIDLINMYLMFWICGVSVVQNVLSSVILIPILYLMFKSGTMIAKSFAHAVVSTVSNEQPSWKPGDLSNDQIVLIGCENCRMYHGKCTNPTPVDKDSYHCSSFVAR